MGKADTDVVYVGLKELTEYLDRTPRRLIQLVDEGVLPKEGRGKYPLKDCIKAFVQHLSSLADGRSNKSELSEEKLLTARVERRRRELQLAQVEGSLITVDAHEQTLAEALDLVRTNLRNLPGSVAPRLVGYDDPRDVLNILSPAVDDAMRSIVSEAERRILDDDLPEGVPGRRYLLEYGIEDLPALVALPDLEMVPGIGRARATQIKDWIEKELG